MKSINEILNSLLQNTQGSNSLPSANASNGPKGPVSGSGSFKDVLSQLASQNTGSSNPGENSSSGNNAAPNGAIQTPSNSPSAPGNNSGSVISINQTDIQVTETARLNNPSAKDLANLEQSVMSLAAGLSKLVQLASNLQNMDQSQAQNLLVSASGGTISLSDAQNLLNQIAAIKNSGSSQNSLLLNSGQQNALLAQMLQGMIQNQQITLTQNPSGQSASNSTNPIGSSSTAVFLQVNFSDTQIMESQSSNNQSLFVDLQTLNVKMAAVQILSTSFNTNTSNSTAANLTQATTDRLTNLLQELQVTPANSPVSINVQGATVPVTNTPELAENFQNLVRVLTQAGAGQAVLSNFLAQQKNDTTGELKQAFNQNLSLENLLNTANSAVEVPPVSSASSTGLLNNNPLGSQNQGLPETPSFANLNGIVSNNQAADFSLNSITNNSRNGINQAVELSLNSIENNSQNSNTQNQVALLSAGLFIAEGQENNLAASNSASQPVFQTVTAPVSGEVEALNAIVALFNSGVVQAKGANVSANTLNGTINGAGNPNVIPGVNQPVIAAAQVQTVVPVSQVNPNELNALISNNSEIQLVQSTSPATQQANTSLDTSLKNDFVQTVSINNLSAAAINAPSLAPVTTGLDSQTASVAVNLTPVAVPTVPATQTIVTVNGNSVQVNLSSAPSSATVSTPSIVSAVTAPVVTAPVSVLPSASTAPNVSASAVVGEVVKGSVPAPVLNSNTNAGNQPMIPNVQSVAAVQPATPVAAAPVATNSEVSTSLNTASNLDKNLSNDANTLQAQVNALVGSASTSVDKTSGNFQTAVANAAAANTPNGNVDSGQILNQISQQVAAQTAEAKTVSRLTFELVPENLGKVTIQVALVDQSVSARIIVSNPDVREALQQHMVDLKTAMNQAGLQIDQLQVQVGGGSSNLLTQYFQYQQEGSGYRLPVAAPPSELSQTLENTGVLGVLSLRTSLVNVLA